MIQKIGHWAILFLVTELTFVFLTWLINPKYLKETSIFIILFTALTVSIGFIIEHKKYRKRVKVMQNFLDDPNEAAKQDLLFTMGANWDTTINALDDQLQKQSAIINQEQINMQNYRDFIESWTHEIKTPLSLITLVLDNYRDEMSPHVYSRMNYARHQINEDVGRILFYARLQTNHVDYNFSKIHLDECIQEVVMNFQALAEERGVEFQLSLLSLDVVTDKKVLDFILSQLLDNAIKYAAKIEGRVWILIWQEKGTEKKTHLTIRDNGIGVPIEDAPFIFDKGFTGNHPERQKATGMGLYLVKKYAASISIEVKLEPAADGGFGIELIFPDV